MSIHLSKEEWFRKKLRSGFFIFDRNEFPTFTKTSYDPILFEIVNAGYIAKKRLDDFFKALEPFILFEDKKNDFRLDNSKSEEMRDALIKGNILDGITAFELEPKGSAHLDFLESVGAKIAPETRMEIPVKGPDAIKIGNWKKYISGKHDITFSNELMDEHSGIKYENHSAVYCGFELYSLFANITKKNGFTFHANGSVISSLYETYFQFIGYKVIEYFRNSGGEFKFTIVMQKINDKETDSGEFKYIYNELKSRWPTRYGN